MKGRLRFGLLSMLCILAAAGSSAWGEWELLGSVPEARFTYDMTVTPEAVYMTLGDSLDNALGLYRCERATGEMEFLGRPGEPLLGLHVAGENDEHIWLGSDDVGFLWYSSDGGTTWSQRDEVVDYSGLYAVTGSRSGDRLYISPMHGFCFQSSRDLGENWISYGDCAEGFPYPTLAMEADVFDRDRAYSVTVHGPVGLLLVLETTDQGNSWDADFIYGTDAAFYSIYPSPFVTGDVTVVDAYGEVFQRLDGEWTELVPGADFNTAYGIVQPVWDGGALWAAGRVASGRIYVRRREAGATEWEHWVGGLPAVYDGAYVHRARLWACPSNGDVFLSLGSDGLWTWRSPTSSMEQLRLREESVWARAHPNPARGSVHLRVSNVPDGCFNLALYDVRGRRLLTRVGLAIEGSWNWTWDGRTASGPHAPAGVYLLKLSAKTGRVLASNKVFWLGQ
ncbi:MAG: hypothetical protein GF355_10700 [Candidatus Eisenbacteria bacterium]|nr:hypothetical protein [Candidatus Eisenbacteria bacterium]